ncbi:MAG: tetratricopeptide repeat protein [Actinomycetota bacterium]|nr:tetratricopeptide repeat protein [Actinomycetota bacterium]
MVDVTDDTFATEVLDRSTQVPVVVDLWAPWCSPCRMLGPIIEKAVDDTDGAVALVKVNVDENPRIAATFEVQSIPAVYALKDRKVVDGFIGAQGEQVVRAFIDRITPGNSEVDELVAAGDEASLRKAIELVPDHPGAIVALAEMLVGRGETDEAVGLLSRVPESSQTRRVLALARLGAQAPTGSGELEGKLDQLLDRVKQDDAARQEFLDLLATLAEDDPRSLRYRRALSARLF